MLSHTANDHLINFTYGTRITTILVIIHLQFRPWEAEIFHRSYVKSNRLPWALRCGLLVFQSERSLWKSTSVRLIVWLSHVSFVEHTEVVLSSSFYSSGWTVAFSTIPSISLPILDNSSPMFVPPSRYFHYCLFILLSPTKILRVPSDFFLNLTTLQTKWD